MKKLILGICVFLAACGDRVVVCGTDGNLYKAQGQYSGAQIVRADNQVCIPNQDGSFTVLNKTSK